MKLFSRESHDKKLFCQYLNILEESKTSSTDEGDNFVDIVIPIKLPYRFRKRMIFPCIHIDNSLDILEVGFSYNDASATFKAVVFNYERNDIMHSKIKLCGEFNEYIKEMDDFLLVNKIITAIDENMKDVFLSIVGLRVIGFENTKIVEEYIDRRINNIIKRIWKTL